MLPPVKLELGLVLLWKVRGLSRCEHGAHAFSCAQSQALAHARMCTAP